MKHYLLDDLRNNLDVIMKMVACGGESVSVQVDDDHKAILVDENEWNILCDGFAHLIGGTRIMK